MTAGPRVKVNQNFIKILNLNCLLKKKVSTTSRKPCTSSALTNLERLTCNQGRWSDWHQGISNQGFVVLIVIVSVVVIFIFVVVDDVLVTETVCL